jgi:sigma-B regulation protein RsbU (phosphoserine phosphatase)
MFPNSGSLRSVMIAPLLVDGVLTGAVCAVNNKTVPGRSFSQEQMDCLSQLRNEIIMIQDLVRVYSEISRRDRLDQELSFARSLQMSLLPADSPEWGEFSIDARTCPAKEVNGDFYDFIRIDDDRMLVLLGDACGKGIPACMLSAMTRSFARSMVGTFTTLNKFMRDINDKLNRDTDVDRFVTLGCCLLDRKHNLLEFGRAGHTDLVSFIHHHIRIISPNGSALGILPDEFVAFDTMCIAVDPESTMMMYSDGMTEAIDRDSNEFGQEKLSEVFKTACSKHDETSAIIDDIMQSVSDYEAEQSDDRTVVLIRRGGHYADK